VVEIPFLCLERFEGAAREGAQEWSIALSVLHTIPRHHRCATSTAFGDLYGRDDHATTRHSASLGPVEDYTNKYKL
jgi:hypothetical protein